MKVKRETLLAEVESVSPGLSDRGIIEQSSCFVFKDGEVKTFNDEVSCRCPSSLDVTCAVQAAPLLKVLNRMTEDEIDVEVDEELKIKGRRKSTGIRTDHEITLPLKDVELPEEGSWHRLPKKFSQAIDMVRDCASKDKSTPRLTCVNIRPHKIETCDNYQVARFDCKTGFSNPVLVKCDAIQHILNRKMRQVAETDNWAHFANDNGLVFSCRRYEEAFPKLDPFFDFSGQVVELPDKTKIIDAANGARIFSGETEDKENMIRVSIKKGKFRIRGEGDSGWHTEYTKMKNYEGDPITFLIAPDLLIKIAEQHGKCEIGQGRLKVEFDNFSYVTVVGQDQEDE